MTGTHEEFHPKTPLSLKNLSYGVTILAFIFIVGVSVVVAIDLRQLTALAWTTRTVTIPNALQQHEKALKVRQLGLFSDIIAASDLFDIREEAFKKAQALVVTLSEKTPQSMQARLQQALTDIEYLKKTRDTMQQNKTLIIDKVSDADLALHKANTTLTAIILEKSEELQRTRNSAPSLVQTYLYASQLKNIILSLRLRLASLKDTATLAETYNEESFFNGLMDVSTALIDTLDTLPAWQQQQSIRQMMAQYKDLAKLFAIQREVLGLLLQKTLQLRKINENLASIADDITSNGAQLASDSATKITTRAETTLKKTQVAFSLLALGFILIGITIRMRVVQPIVRAAKALRHIAKHEFSEQLLPSTGNLQEIIDINKGVEQLSQTLQTAAKTNEKLLALTQAKNYFVSSVSHELKTPLTTIFGFSRRINDDFSHFIAPAIAKDVRLQKKSDRIISNLSIIVKETDRLNRLIDDVLDVARIDAGRMPWNDKKVAILEVIELTKQAVAEEFAKKPLVKLVLELPKQLPLLFIDPDRLQQVLINLLVNAVKFTEKGCVTLKCWQEDAMLLCSISDTGIGIREEDFAMIFKRFQQALLHEDNVKNKPKGTGLGLTISKQIIEHYKGTISVSSTFGKGTTFTLALPLTQEDYLI
jgi:signal transduction histidine kinase